MRACPCPRRRCDHCTSRLSLEHACDRVLVHPTVGNEHERLDLHNASIDASAAALGHCGTTDLHNGRVCQSPAQHHGSCEFTLPGA